MKKRIKIQTYATGEFHYVPQYRWLFMWFDFKNEYGESKYFIMESRAMNFLYSCNIPCIHNPLKIIKKDYRNYIESK